MRTLLSLMALVLAATAAPAQRTAELFTRPEIPSREVLDRLHLQVGWYTYLPVDGRKDGVFTVQLTGKEMLVQTRSGLIVSLDPETGRTYWRTAVGLPYRNWPGLAYNSTLVLVINGTSLYALDRATGARQWHFELTHSPAATPTADEEQVYIPLGNGRLSVFLIASAAQAPKLPGTYWENPDLPARPSDYQRGPSVLPEPGTGPRGMGLHSGGPPPVATTGGYTSRESTRSGAEAHPPLELLFEASADYRMELPAVVTPEVMAAADSHGTLVGMSRFAPKTLWQFPAEAPISAQLEQHGDTVYAASQDRNLYALDMLTGKLLWRYTVPTPILRKPDVTDQEIYVAPTAYGLYRLERQGGDELWHNAAAARFLAANQKFVYATDSGGQLLVLDHRRGRELSCYPMRDFTVRISNEWTDRVYLAANDGLLLCLHDSDYARPVINRKVEEKPAALPPGKGGKPGPKPPVQKPPEEKPPEKPADEKPKDKDAGKDKEMKP
jgi:outer membrane protein assembly factor BamB